MNNWGCWNWLMYSENYNFLQNLRILFEAHIYHIYDMNNIRYYSELWCDLDNEKFITWLLTQSIRVQRPLDQVFKETHFLTSIWKSFYTSSDLWKQFPFFLFPQHIKKLSHITPSAQKNKRSYFEREMLDRLYIFLKMNNRVQKASKHVVELSEGIAYPFPHRVLDSSLLPLLRGCSFFKGYPLRK
jgi:hypothetical protein